MFFLGILGSRHLFTERCRVDVEFPIQLLCVNRFGVPLASRT